MNKLVRQAFTLIELLVVIAIIGILSGLIVISMSGVTQKANIAKAQVFSNSLRNSLMLNTVSEWRFDGSTADNGNAVVGDVLDTWSGVNNGSLSTVPPKVRTGSNCASGSCLQFDGSAASGSYNFADFGNNSSLSMGLGGATVSFWAYFDNALAPMIETLIVCGAGNSTTPGYWMYRASGTSLLKVEFNDGSTGSIAGNLTSSGALINNTWYNIVVVFDRDSNMYAYINGVKKDEYAVISGKKQSISNPRNYTIGSYSTTAHRFAGKMDDVRVYNAIISTSQIKQQYYSGLNSMLANGAITPEEYSLKLSEVALR